jgi:hypothetical protein
VTTVRRDDVRRSFPNVSPTSGFDVTLDVPRGRRLVCVHAVDRRNNSTKLLDAREINVT